MTSKIRITATLLISLASLGYVSTAYAGADGNPMAPGAVSTNQLNVESDQQAQIAALQSKVLALQSEVQTLQSTESTNTQSAENANSTMPTYSFSAAPMPNHDGAPIPNGDYPPGW
jgi:TolA-binding protein